MCDYQVSAASAIPTCFTGLAQSPIDINANSGTVQDEDPGQISFIGYNDQLGETPMLRLKDFTVQLDFEETPAIQPTVTNTTRVGSVIQSTVRRREQLQKTKNTKKMHRKQKGKRKKQARRRFRDAIVPFITGGALGQDT